MCLTYFQTACQKLCQNSVSGLGSLEVMIFPNSLKHPRRNLGECKIMLAT